MLLQLSHRSGNVSPVELQDLFLIGSESAICHGTVELSGSALPAALS
jgi:hypothetical protein